ncbi:protein SpAN-like isoform X2 [Mytilus edulis]|uniref:protein SpAN-like isoform X2 n=1 Tax=Mytilus edulis TaxID=6550 RepID=UPI0039EE0230
MGIEQGNENRNFYVGRNTYWENGIVPYTIKGSLSDTKERKIIETAIEELARKTCIQLVPKGSIEAQGLSHTTYIEFIDLPGCWSYVGRNPSGVQHISLQNPGCVDHSTVQHEILHALGMWHEQNRLDRDDYIRILKENVTSGNEFNFDKKKTSDTRPYDAESVMQYSLYSFGKEIGNTTLKTMEFVDKNLEFLADLDAGLDFYDVADITDAYQCAAHCKGSSRPKCENGGFVDHNCECFCPSGLKGDNCQTVETSSACGGIVYVSKSKVTEIKTPNWPSSYPVGTKCTWLIKAPAEMYVKLTEDELSLPYNTLDRCYHWMEVRYNLIGQLGVKICGEAKNRIWTTTSSGESNLMMVRFDAKFAEDRDPWQGFKISATAFNKDSNPTTLPSDSTPTTLPTTLPSDSTPTTLPTTLPSDSTPTTLPSEPLTCTFETGSDCFLMNDPTAKLTWKQQRFSTPTPGTGPYGAKEGQYYSYMESSHPAGSTGQELTATFVMRNEISEAQPRCLSIYYSMHGATMGSLEVYRKGSGIPKDLIFIKEGEQGNQWNLANISILPVSDLQIYIEAVRGSTHLSDIGIDDVKLTPGYCNIICTFEPEDPNCVFDLSKGDYNWDIKQGKTLSAHTGPSRAHSGQFYAYLEASDRPMGGTAVMSFKVPPMAHNEYCLSFAYNMNGGNMGELTVQNEAELWTKKGNQGHSWKEAKVPITAETGDRIEIVATLGYDYTSDIAVDDIEMKEGVC